MFDSPAEVDGSRSELDPELLQSLERQKSDEIARQRIHARIDAKLRVVVKPGNSSELLALKIQGLTADISRGGCRLILPMPLGVGDLYRVEFDSSAHQLPLVFARCLRCRLLREDAFEVGLSFFTQIELPASLFQQQDDLLG